MKCKGVDVRFINGYVMILIYLSFVACGPNLLNKKTSNYKIEELDPNNRGVDNLDAEIKKGNKDDFPKIVAQYFEVYTKLLVDGEISLQQYASNLYRLQEGIYSIFPAPALSEVSRGICILYLKEDVELGKVSENKDIIEYENKVVRSKSDDIDISLCEKFFKDNLGDVYEDNPSKFALTTSVRSNMK